MPVVITIPQPNGSVLKNTNYSMPFTIATAAGTSATTSAAAIKAALGVGNVFTLDLDTSPYASITKLEIKP